MADPYPLRPITEDEYDAFHLVDQHAFNGGPQPATERALFRRKFEFDRSLAAFDGSQPVGTAGAYSFQLSVPGAMLPAAGVSFVAVLPSYRRRGILRSMMRHQLADVAERGEPIAALWASEAMLYGRYGYGTATWQANFSFRRGEGALAQGAPVDPDLRLRLADPGDVRQEIAKVYDTVLSAQPGFFARNDAWWDTRIFDPAENRQGRSPLRCLVAEDSAGARGYALYSALGRWTEDEFLADGHLLIKELFAADPAANAALWQNLLDRDLITEVEARIRPVDDPVLFQVADPRRARPRMVDGLWIRLVDLPAALCARAYSCPVTAVLEVRDDLLPANSGRWRLDVHGPAGEAGTVTCERTTAPADITLDVRALGAAYLGAVQLGSLGAAGVITQHRPGTLRWLSAAMTWTPTAWCPVIF